MADLLRALHPHVRISYRARVLLADAVVVGGGGFFLRVSFIVKRYIGLSIRMVYRRSRKRLFIRLVLKTVLNVFCVTAFHRLPF